MDMTARSLPLRTSGDTTASCSGDIIDWIMPVCRATTAVSVDRFPGPFREFAEFTPSGHKAADTPDLAAICPPGVNSDRSTHLHGDPRSPGVNLALRSEEHTSELQSPM